MASRSTSSPIAADKNNIERYIEVTTGEQFAVVVKLHPNFSFGSARSIKVVKKLDDYTSRFNDYLKRTVVRGRGRPQVFMEVWDGWRCTTEEGWKSVSPVFSLAKFDEDEHLTVTEADECAQKVGTIKVTIERGAHKRLERKNESRWRFPTTDAVEGMKVALKGITHTVKPKLQSIASQIHYRYDWKPVKRGAFSKRYTFIFRYRSHRKYLPTRCRPFTEKRIRESLQQLGLISTPLASTLQQVAIELSPKSTELQDQQPNGQASAPASNALVPTTSEHNARALSVKREHEQADELLRADSDAANGNRHGRYKRIKTEATDEPQVVELSDDDENTTNPRPSPGSAASSSTSADDAMRHDEQDLHDELRQLEIEKRQLLIQKKLREIQKGKGKAKGKGDVKQESV